MHEVDRSDYIRFLEEALDNQSLGQRIQVVLAIAVILLGVIAICVTQFFPDIAGIANQKLLGALGGGTVSAFSAFPIKQITERRAQVAALRFLLNGFRRLQQEQPEQNAERAQLEERFWKLMDASLSK